MPSRLSGVFTITIAPGRSCDQCEGQDNHLPIIQIFCLVDDAMKNVAKHSQAKLYPSELVTIGILFALKGGTLWAFYRWLKRDYDTLFAGLPERTRLQRLLKTHQDWNRQLLAEPSFFTVIDSYPIELLFPIRQGRSPQQVGKKGKDKGRSLRRDQIVLAAQ
jgi:hypothetical protein